MTNCMLRASWSLFFGLATLAVHGTDLAAQTQRPNVLVILTDDQGWGDLSIHGNRNLRTPHLDSLASQGISFTNFYVCPVCAPTRAEFLTGRYHSRTGVSGVSRGNERMRADETTIAMLFKRAGFRTGLFGKWHNGTQPPLHPRYRGFDEFYGFTSGHWGHYFSPPLDHNELVVRGKGFIADDFTDRTLEFIRETSSPWFCTLAFNTPHSPMMVPDRFYRRFDGIEPELRHREPAKEDVSMTRAALAMVENIDWNVGRIIKTLDEVAPNTITVFFSDNGPNSYRFNGGMKGRKGSIDEGGVRSPLFIRWPGNIKPATQCDQVAAAIDLLPTLTEIAGVPMRGTKPIDGISLSAVLRGDSLEPPERSIYSVRRNEVSVRSDRFRLDAQGRLFDISADRGQRVDVAETHPEVALRLTQQQAEFLKLVLAEREKSKDRPFDVGYSTQTVLPARDGVPHGAIERSSKAPNNSFFTNWRSSDAYISWDVDVLTKATYEVEVRYTCASGDQGMHVILGSSNSGASVSAPVLEFFDPPLYDKSKERVAKSHYFVKDFKPLSLGKIELAKGRSELRLRVDRIIGRRGIDVHSLVLRRSELPLSH